jgi:uncharacterized iron-regulated membrane protein
VLRGLLAILLISGIVFPLVGVSLLIDWAFAGRKARTA